MDVVGDQEDHAVPEQAVTLATGSDVRESWGAVGVASGGTHQQGEHLQQGDLSVDQVGQEEDEAGNAEPVAEARPDGRPHQGALHLETEGGTSEDR